MDPYNAEDLIAAYKEYIKTLEKNKHDITIIDQQESLKRNFKKKLLSSKEVLDWLQTEADSGNSFAQNALAYCYDIGLGVETNLQTSLKFYKSSAELGNLWSINNLGQMYTLGIDGFLDIDYSEAFRLFKLAAEKGLLEGYHNLATLHQNGQGTTQDFQEAIKYYKIASDKGYAPSQCELGVLYEQGRGVSRDLNEATRLYGLSANNGYAKAQYYLGLVYRRGMGTASDAKEAKRWYKMAADQQHYFSRLELLQMYRLGQYEEADVGLIVEWLEEMINKKETQWCKMLSQMYMTGHGVKKDYKKAIEILNRCYDAPFQNAYDLIIGETGKEAFLKDMFTKWSDYDSLKEKNAQLEQENDLLKTEITYMPGGEGYQQAMEHAQQVFDITMTARQLTTSTSTSTSTTKN